MLMFNASKEVLRLFQNGHVLQVNTRSGVVRRNESYGRTTHEFNPRELARSIGELERGGFIKKVTHYRGEDCYQSSGISRRW